VKLDVDKVKEFLRTNVVLVIAVAIMLVLLVVLYVPKLSYLTELKGKFERRAEDLRGKHELIDRLVEIGQEHKEMEVHLARVRREHAGHSQIARIQHSLTAHAGDLILDLRRFIRSPQEKKKFFVKVPLELEIEADYKCFAEYLHRVIEFAKLLDVRRIEIKHDDKLYPRVDVKLLVDAYFLEEGGVRK
jgi:Tfp pilus assembly protein PilO